MTARHAFILSCSHGNLKLEFSSGAEHDYGHAITLRCETSRELSESVINICLSKSSEVAAPCVTASDGRTRLRAHWRSPVLGGEREAESTPHRERGRRRGFGPGLGARKRGAR